MSEAETQPSSQYPTLQDEVRLLQTLLHIATTTSGILDLEKLLEATVSLIQNLLSYFFVNLYLIDETNSLAVMHAGTGEVGLTLLERKHKVEINSSTLIGRCIRNHATCMMGNADLSLLSFQHPLILDVKSAIALPMTRQDKIIGVLEILDFGRDASTLQEAHALLMMADHIAVTIDNARHFCVLQERSS